MTAVRRMRRTISNLRSGLVGLVLIALVPAIGLFLLGDAGPGRAGDLQWKLGILLGLIGVSLVAAWAWSRAAILGPMDAILAAAHRMREGDLRARIGLETLGGDLGALAQAFDGMAATLESRGAEASQAGAALRETNERLHAILNASPLAIVTHDRQGHLMHWNPAAERTFGWRSDEVLGRFIPWTTEDKLEETLDLVRRTSEGERLAGIAVRRRRKDGRPVDLRVFSAPLRRPDGTIYGTLSVIEDVTERTLLEGQFHRSQKMQAVGRLAGALAHDFNNLLTVIRGYSELALRKTGPHAPARANLIGIRNAALRANHLIRQLLTFSREPVGEPRVLDLNRTIEDVVRLIRPLLGESVRLTVETGAEAGCVRADAGQLAQILTNLAVNGREAMPRGGEIVVRTSRVDGASRRGAPDLSTGDWSEITVSDTGAGMDAETLQHAFDPFFSTKASPEGAGLGLTTVYGIVTHAGGHVRVESEPGRGTRVHIFLPRVAAAAAEDTAGAEPELPLRGSGTLLVVEDEVEVRAVLCESLESAGYTVLPAADGAEALEIGGRHAGPIDLLLTDVVMPGLGGPELAGRLIAQRPRLRVLFISGYAPVASEAALQALPGTAFIAKPFDFATLAARIHDLLQPPESEARAA